MKKVIHIEDNPGWRQSVRSALMLNTEIEPVVAYGSMDEFRKANYPRADLYVCDRHLPEKKGERPNDESWKSLLSTISCLHSNSPIIIFSSMPPRSRKYLGVVELIQKPSRLEDFDFAAFRERVEKHLGLNGGSC